MFLLVPELRKFLYTILFYVLLPEVPFIENLSKDKKGLQDIQLPDVQLQTLSYQEFQLQRPSATKTSSYQDFQLPSLRSYRTLR